MNEYSRTSDSGVIDPKKSCRQCGWSGPLGVEHKCEMVSSKQSVESVLYFIEHMDEAAGETVEVNKSSLEVLRAEIERLREARDAFKSDSAELQHRLDRAYGALHTIKYANPKEWSYGDFVRVASDGIRNADETPAVNPKGVIDRRLWPKDPMHSLNCPALVSISNPCSCGARRDAIHDRELAAELAASKTDASLDKRGGPFDPFKDSKR